MTLIWLVLLHCKFDDSQHLFDNLALLDAVGHFSVLLISIGLVEHFDDGFAFLREDYGRDVEGCVLCEDSAFAIESELLREFEAAGVLLLVYSIEYWICQKFHLVLNWLHYKFVLICSAILQMDLENHPMIDFGEICEMTSFICFSPSRLLNFIVWFLIVLLIFILIMLK